MEHRRTLGALSSSALNSRMSLGAPLSNGKLIVASGRKSMAPTYGRMSIASRPSVTGGRSSLGRQSLGSARFSTSGRPSVGGMAQDPRPIKDKGYQQQCKYQLISFLTSHNYDAPISPKILTSPSVRDFRSIVSFLFQRLDPNFIFDDKTFNDELSEAMRRLGYPFAISKSALGAVGSPHTWPYILAALVWLIELIQAVEGVEAHEEKTSTLWDPQANPIKLFYDYLGPAYTTFLHGEDSYEALEEGLAQTFASRNKNVSEGIERLQHEMESMHRAIDGLRKHAEQLPALQRKKQELERDLEKFKDYAANMQKHKEQVAKKLQEKQQEKERVECAQNDEALENQSLQAQIDAQGISPADLQRIMQEKSRLENTLAALEAQKEELQKKNWELETAMHQRIEEVQRLVAAYNDKGAVLQIIPASAKYAADQDLSVTFHPDNIQGMLDRMKRVIKPALVSVRDEFRSQIRMATDALQAEQERCAVAQRKDQEKSEELRDQRARLKKLEVTYEEERATFTKELNDIVEQVEETELLNNKLKTSMASLVIQTQQEVQQLEFEREQLVSLIQEQGDRLRDEVVELMDGLTQHKDRVNELIEALVQHSARTCQAVSQMAVQV